MKLYYSYKTLLREKGATLIKVASLTLGLAIGLILLGRVGFEFSFDNHYKEVDHLMRIKGYYTIGDERRKVPSNYIVEPLPQALKENFPSEIESVTLVGRDAGNVFFNGTHRISELRSLYGDTLYFQTMGIDVLAGDPAELGNVDVAFISDKLAKQISGDDSPIGKVLNRDKNYPITVRGVFRELPENTTSRPDVVISYPSIYKVWNYTRSWDKDDSFFGYVRLRGTDPSSINSRIDQMVLNYMPDNGKDGFKVEYFLQPIREDYVGTKEVKTMVVIMSLLAIVLLLIAALNYVLITLSSLARRAKSVGIHKCSGATDGNILAMSLIETGIILLLSLLLVVLLFFNFREPLEELVVASLSSLFSWQSLWIPASVLVVLFLLVGVLPGQMFARMPVSMVFRRYTEGKTKWKRPLLFVQFGGLAFIGGLLLVVLSQYNYVLNKPLGYKPDNVAFAYVEVADLDFLKADLKRMPVVESVGISSWDIGSGWGGLPIKNANGKTLFTARWNSFDQDYLPAMQMELAEGKNIDGAEQILINESFVKAMKMESSPVGKPLPESGREGVVVGVMKDFPVFDRYESIKPVMVESRVGWKSKSIHVAVRLHDLTTESLLTLNQKMEELYPLEDIRFESLSKYLEDQYQGARRFRDAVILASVFIVVIAVIGLFGYVGDEIRRRTKEIAIRKVNGAESWDILSILGKDLLWTVLPAVLLGVSGAYYVGGFWQDQFAEKVELGAMQFVLIAVGVFALIGVSVVFRAWHVANENPVKSIKSE